MYTKSQTTYYNLLSMPWMETRDKERIKRALDRLLITKRLYVDIDISIGAQVIVYRLFKNKLVKVLYKIIGDECAICLNDVGDYKMVHRLPCQHSFHGSCIQKWLEYCQGHDLKSTCPTCRFEY